MSSPFFDGSPFDPEAFSWQLGLLRQTVDTAVQVGLERVLQTAFSEAARLTVDALSHHGISPCLEAACDAYEVMAWQVADPDERRFPYIGLFVLSENAGEVYTWLPALDAATLSKVAHQLDSELGDPDEDGELRIADPLPRRQH